VGVRMTAYMPEGSLAHVCKMGVAKATVLPEPVREPPMTSRPASICGMLALWIRVGCRMKRCDSDVTSHGERPSVANVLVPGSIEDAMLCGKVSSSVPLGSLAIAGSDRACLVLIRDMLCGFKTGLEITSLSSSELAGCCWPDGPLSSSESVADLS
jgi:hypothetical protein